mmetsp:Transcript_77181/g.213366  ORF Transcript_77181/g.213366 Transcript_77181/m.213366 type:complete len:236 (+) Transcript_77181:2692-3399(+)
MTVRGLALDDRGLGHLCKSGEDIQLHALLSLLEARNQRGGERGVDLLQLVGETPHHGSQHLQSSPANLPGIVIVIRVHKAVVVKLFEAVVHGVLRIACVVKVRVIRDQVEDHIAQFIQVRRYLLGAPKHKGFEGVQAVLHHLVVLLIVAVHGHVLFGGLVDNLKEQRGDLAEMLTNAETDIPADGADALDILLLLRLRRSGAHVPEEHLHEGIQLPVCQDGGERPNAGDHLLSQR